MVAYDIISAMREKIGEIVEKLFAQSVEVELDRPDPQFGDFSTNVALKLAKPLGRNPREVAEEIALKLREIGEFEKVEVAGPGFINITLSDRAILSLVEKRPEKIFENQKIVFEYSCPNAFKELHTGHLYQTIYGDIVSRMMLVGGAELIRTSFGGDVGLHVARCLWGMQKTLGGDNPEKLGEAPEDVFERARWISGCYVEGAKAYESDDETKQQIDQLNKVIYGFHERDDHDSPLAQIYWTTRQWSFDYFDAFYELIDVEKMRYIPESQTMPIGMRVVDEQLTKGNLKQSDGAVVFEGDPEKHLHTRVFVTGQGLPTYETKDIGVIWLERADYDFDHRYLLTGNDQIEYMRVVFAAAETFDPSLTGKMTHFANGTVKFSDGQKMSSRLGNVARGADVIDAVRERVAELVKDAGLIDAVTLGAVKYAFAKYKLGGDINFDIEETVSLQGNSGPYLQYAHARARRIIEKSDFSYKSPDELYDEDKLLVRKLSEYHEVVDRAVASLEPHHICTYLFDLAQEFNRYYENNRVIGDEKEAHRLSLVAIYADILKAGLAILGIEAPERM